ncbi:MAG: COX15/CtaA family protein [Alphaproteobacteria bacterium]
MGIQPSFVGVLAFLPLLFLFKSIPTWLRWRIAGVFALGGIQGAIGWWMVKSGLKADPAVSHIRLCTHLVMTLLILSILAGSLWRFQGKKFSKLLVKDAILLTIIALTIVYGAFVAGLKAGLIYNTFPLMGGDWCLVSGISILLFGLISLITKHWYSLFIDYWRY